MKPRYIEYEIAFAGCLMIVLIGIASCKDSSNPITKLDEIVFPDSNISYNKQVQPLFNVGCALAGCHDSQTRANDLELTSYYGIRYGKPGVVIAKDTAKSRLIWEIEGRSGLAENYRFHILSSNHVKGFRRWIMEGANETP